MSTLMTEDELTEETRAILDGWPFTVVQRDALGFLVGLGRKGIEYSGHTGIDNADPRDLARRLLARAGGLSVAPALAEDEDPGEQPEIFTEEDVEALDVESDPLSESEAADNSGTGGSGDSESGGGEAAYPGIAILPDELGARRNAVLAAITTEKLTRLKIAMDPSMAQHLSARFAEYQNRGALGLEIDDLLLADYRAYLAMKDRQEHITNYAMQLEQSALDGDMDRLEAMHAGLSEGWPT